MRHIHTVNVFIVWYAVIRIRDEADFIFIFHQIADFVVLFLFFQILLCHKIRMHTLGMFLPIAFILSPPPPFPFSCKPDMAWQILSTLNV